MSNDSIWGALILFWIIGAFYEAKKKKKILSYVCLFLDNLSIRQCFWFLQFCLFFFPFPFWQINIFVGLNQVLTFLYNEENGVDLKKKKKKLRYDAHPEI